MIDDRASDHAQAVLASNLRRLRVARHLSLSELARATGISKATLSGIERGRGNPTVDTVARLAGALGSSLGELLDVAPVGEIRIVRSSQVVPAQGDSVPQRLLDGTPAGGGPTVAELMLDARSAYEVAARASGTRAQLYVLEGKLIAGPVERYTELATGDYASFPADVPLLYEATHRPARALLVTQVPG